MMRQLLCALAILSFASIASAGSAQKDAGAPAPEYLLGPEDVIEITVLNHPELNKTLVVLPDGKISFPEVGELQAAGKTPKQLAAEIHAGLDKVRNNVAVNVLVREIRSRKVSVVGAVKTPGSYPLKRDSRLMEVVAMAGGFLNKPARVKGRLLRGGTHLISLNVPQAVEQPDSASNIPLEPDDVLLFEEIEPIQIFIGGQVQKPGIYAVEPGTTLLPALSAAGSPLEDAALDRAYVEREGQRISIGALHKVIKDGQSDEKIATFALRAGDMIFLPRAEQKRFAVQGAVTKPGFYPLPDKEEVNAFQALGIAGGQNPQADTAKAGIIRLVGNKPELIPVNFDEMFKKRDFSKNIPLQPEDILYVPVKGRSGFDWRDVLSPISALGVLGFRLWR